MVAFLIIKHIIIYITIRTYLKSKKSNYNHAK
ncbi:MAG: hypothetical protein RLZZ210_981 [Pseudomonadota bacterium]|jgi:hypothetical protein